MAPVKHVAVASRGAARRESRVIGQARAGLRWNPPAGLVALLLMAFAVVAQTARAGDAMESTAGESQPVGARFILSAHDGRTVTDETFRGKHLVVFFGYTSCPDVCPTSLQTLAIALGQLGPLATKVQPLFVSLDPERDSRETIAAYVASFDPRIVGLTGTRDMIERVARGYRIKHERVPGSRPGDYTIDHTASMFHMGPDGRYLGRYTQAMSPEDIAADLRRALSP